MSQPVFETVFQTISGDHFLPAADIRKGLNRYNDEEVQRIFSDFQVISKMTFEGALQQKIYVVTAGGPGAGKSTFFESQTAGQKFAYIDPDRTCLLKMQSTYLFDIKEGKTAQKAYEYWRDASNVIANVLVAQALKGGYSVAHGSTLTSPAAGKILAAIHTTYQYSVEILHMTCPEDIRMESIKKREESGVVQATPEDIVNKGKMFYQRLPQYLAHANKITFCFRRDMAHVIEAARYETGKGIEILNPEAYQRVADLHNGRMDGKYLGSGDRELPIRCGFEGVDDLSLGKILMACEPVGDGDRIHAGGRSRFDARCCVPRIQRNAQGATPSRFAASR